MGGGGMDVTTIPSLKLKGSKEAEMENHRFFFAKQFVMPKA
jgi:hypothetical protein